MTEMNEATVPMTDDKFADRDKAQEILGEGEMVEITSVADAYCGPPVRRFVLAFRKPNVLCIIRELK